MKSLNQVNLLGNLTRDPELRQTPNGTSVCNFSLALNRSHKDSNGEWKEAVDFIDIVAWGKLGERIAQWLQKGRQALVSGRLQTRNWEQDGQKRVKVEVLALDVVFLSDNQRNKNDELNDRSQDLGKDMDVSILDDDSNEPISTENIPF